MLIDWHVHIHDIKDQVNPYWQGKCPMTPENVLAAHKLAGLDPYLAALALTPDGAQVVAASALRARGDNWFPTFSHIVAYAGVMPVAGYWLAERQHMNVQGLMFAILAASLLSAAVLVARWWAVTRKA